MDQAARELLLTRPTAVNLAWALDRMAELFQTVKDDDLTQVRAVLLAGAQQMLDAAGTGPPVGDLWESDHPGAGAPADLLQHRRPGDRRIRHRPGGNLPAHQSGKEIHVYVPETRPLLQGARLTAWELEQAGIPFTLITDNMAGYLFSQGHDRSGDRRRRPDCGQRGLCQQDRHLHHGGPGLPSPPPLLRGRSHFHFRLQAQGGQGDPGGDAGAGRGPVDQGPPCSRPDAPVLNPSFDVTPHALVTGYITEFGVFKIFRKYRTGGGIRGHLKTDQNNGLSLFCLYFDFSLMPQSDTVTDRYSQTGPVIFSGEKRGADLLQYSCAISEPPFCTARTTLAVQRT